MESIQKFNNFISNINNSNEGFDPIASITNFLESPYMIVLMTMWIYSDE